MSTKYEQGFAHLLALVLGLSSLLVISSILPVSRNYHSGKSDVAGVYIAKGGDDSLEGSGGSGSSGSGSSGSNDSGGSSGSSSSSGSSGSISEDKKETKNEIKNKEAETQKVETKEVNKKLTVETKTPEKIKSEIRQGNLRIKFEIENGKTKVETKLKEDENEIELEQEVEDEAVDQMEEELEEEDVKIATAPGQIALVNKRVGALSNFPISVDPTTRQLTVTTPAGIKVVTVLPQKAIDNMLASHVMDDVLGEKVNNSLASIPDLVKLETKNGVLVYKVEGTKTHRLLGFIPIKTEVKAFVSAENGEVMESTDSLLGRILNRLTP